MSLRGMMLGGTLELLNFSAVVTLTRLELPHNELAGRLPLDIQLLKELHVLLLHGNQIRGSIPPVLANLTKLSCLVLSHNLLTNQIPNVIGELESLLVLNLSSNHLVGPIPGGIGRLSNFIGLDLSNNILDGQIPISLGNLSVHNNIKFLALPGNNLTGPITKEFGNLVSLDYLDLSQNRFVGCIPTNINNFTKLATLELFILMNSLAIFRAIWRI